MSKLLVVINSPVDKVELMELTGERALPLMDCFFPDLEKILTEFIDISEYEGVAAVSPFSEYQEKAEQIIKKCLDKIENENEQGL